MEAALESAWLVSTSKSSGTLNSSYTLSGSQPQETVISDPGEHIYQTVSLSASSVNVTGKIEVEYMEVVSVPDERQMENQMNKIESDISEIRGKVNSIEERVVDVNKTVDSLRGVPFQAKFANAIATLVFVSIGIITTLFWNNISSLSERITTLDKRVHDLTKDVVVIKTDGGHIKSDIQELKNSTNEKLDKLLERSSSNQ